MSDRAISQLVETDWLHEHLGDEDIRVFDCTVKFEQGPQGVKISSGREEWAPSHIPGSGFLCLLEELSDKSNPLPAMMPSAAQFAEVMGRAGVGPDTRVVLYDASATMWAARVWWMLRYFGFDNAGILSGGLRKWTAEGRPISDTASSYPSARFEARPRPGLIADKDEVMAALDNEDIVLVNALAPEIFSGAVAPYGRAGRIPGSVNVPAVHLIDPQTAALLPTESLRRSFEKAGALGGQRVITYCGGGIAACSNAFALTLLGAEDVAVYDGSLVEWISDSDSPLVTDTD